MARDAKERIFHGVKNEDGVGGGGTRMVWGQSGCGFISEDLLADLDLLPPPMSVERPFPGQGYFFTKFCSTFGETFYLLSYLHKYLLLPSRAISPVKKDSHGFKSFLFSLLL